MPFLLKYKLKSYIFSKIEYFLFNKQTIKLNYDWSACTIMQNKTTDWLIYIVLLSKSLNPKHNEE